MEIELKLALYPRHTTRIRRHLLLSNSKPQHHTLLSIYFDTPKFDLMRRGIALRIRRIGKQWIQTLKAEAQSIGALTSRPEWEAAVESGDRPDFSALPQATLDLLTGIKHKRIAPVFTTEFRRTAWQIVHNKMQAEVALDRGKITAAGQCREICEVEIELKSGKPEFLFDIAVRLLQAAPLHVEPRSKAERGYVLCGAMNPSAVKSAYPAIAHDQSAGKAWNNILQAALVQLSANVPGFLENAHDIEYLHQLRVAMRCLRMGVQLAKSLGQVTPVWEQALRELMHALNPARDWDVFQYEILPDILPVLTAQTQHTTTGDDTFSVLQNAAAQNRQRAQALLLQPAFTQLVLDIGRSLLTMPTDTHQRDVRTWATAILEQRWQKLRKRCHGFSGLNPAERHLVRIAAKKMRYSAEAFAPLYGRKQTMSFITTLAALQNELGMENDQHMAMRLLDELPKKTAILAFQLGQLSGALMCTATQRKHLPSAHWKKLAGSTLFWR